jgi:aldose 1-epimerase
VTIERRSWGSVDEQAVELYTLTNDRGLIARIATYGATLVELHVPDRDGRLADVALGFDTVDDYVRMPLYFGATVGRVGNRIAEATFELNGRRYDLFANHGRHHLHGGRRGWDKRVWSAEPIEAPGGPSLRLTLTSPDGEEGYPGTVAATTQYTLTDANELVIEMIATTDRTTVVNMVHHTYFNLRGTDGDVLDHELQLFADAYTPGMPPGGQVVPVRGTPFDFSAAKPIGRDVAAARSPGGGAPPGYDSNWIVNGESTALRPVARLVEPESGRVLALRANQPGVQFYSGVFLDGSTGGKGRVHALAGGLCLEPQAFPNAINVPGWRDQVTLEPGRTYRHEAVFGFGTDSVTPGFAHGR